MEQIFFYVFAAIALVAAVLLVAFRNPVYSALSLVTAFFALAGLFVLLNAYFLAAVQIIVYAGAIMVLFLFVIMLLNLGHSDALERVAGKYRRVAVVLLAATLVAQLGFMAGRKWAGMPASEDAPLFTDNINTIGRMLYTRYLFPFEVVSVILLVALIGVMVMVKGDREGGENQPR
ncbi:MAG: NADH-quinone oxidoreductase subunit J [Candidatus Latescibacteria bacterium]|nr:NADH-quinone oxidoreductase subunit J [Candidatus Latescibacterota bacterium]